MLLLLLFLNPTKNHTRSNISSPYTVFLFLVCNQQYLFLKIPALCLVQKELRIDSFLTYCEDFFPSCHNEPQMLDIFWGFHSHVFSFVFEATD